MKYTRLFFVLLFIHSIVENASSQNYIPFPDTNGVWTVGAKRIFIKGDSLFNSHVYKKYIQDTPPDPYLMWPQYYDELGLVRQDIPNKKFMGLHMAKLRKVTLRF